MSRRFERLIALCALWAFTAFGQGNFQLHNSYLNNNMNGNGKSITNLASIIATNFYGDGSGLTNILPTDVNAAGVSTELQFRKSGPLGAATNWLYDLTDGSIKAPVELGLKFPTQTNAPFFLGVKSYLSGGVRDNMLMIGYNQKQTNTATVYTREDTNDIWWRMDFENRQDLGGGSHQAEFNLDWGNNESSMVRLIQYFVNNQTTNVAAWFAANTFAIIPAEKYPASSLPIMVFKGGADGGPNRVSIGKNNPYSNTILEISGQTRTDVNQQLVLRTETNIVHYGLIGATNLAAAADTYGFSLIGGPGPASPLSGGTNVVALLLGKNVPYWAIRQSATDLQNASGTNYWTVGASGATNFGSLYVTNNIAAQSGTISNLTASQFVATDASKNLVTSANSAALAATLTDETGAGAAVFAASPTLVTSFNVNNPGGNNDWNWKSNAISMCNFRLDPDGRTWRFTARDGSSGATIDHPVIVNLASGGDWQFGRRVIWQTDNANDIGASGANRPRDLYLGRDAYVTGKIKTLNGDTTAGNGIPSIVGSVNLTAQTATIGNTTIFTTPANSLYEVSGVVLDTSAGSAGTVTVTISWTDEAGATTQTTGTLTLAALGRLQIGPWPISVTSGTAIQYSTTVTGALGSPQYALKIVLKRLQ